MNSFLKVTFIFGLSFVLLGCVESTSNKKYELASSLSENREINEALQEDQEIVNFLAPYAKKIDQEMNQELSYTKKPMFKTDSKFNTAIGNLMADAVFEQIKPLAKEKFNIQLDAVLLNYGGIRSGISEGKITVKTAFDIMPFENKVVIVELSYKKMNELFEYLAKNEVAHPFAGIKLEINQLSEITHQKIYSKELKEGETYFIATSDYLLKGGDQMNFFIDNESVFEINYKLRNLFIDYFKSKDEIVAEKDNRFVKVQR